MKCASQGGATVCHHVPSIWRAESTTIQDRQEIVRLLIERIEVTSRGRTEWVDVVVRWAGEAETQHALRRPILKYQQMSDYESLRSAFAWGSMFALCVFLVITLVIPLIVMLWWVIRQVNSNTLY
jgi:hypothetical protein